MSPEELRDGAVTIAHIHSREVSYSWHHSIVQLLGYDVANNARIFRGGWVSRECATAGLVEARNEAVKSFLEDDKADWLFWVDTDMGFEADTLDRLFAVADPVERPIVGALCFTQRQESSDGMGGWTTRATPTIFDWLTLDSGEQGFTVRFDYPKAASENDGLVECDGTGSACILIHRSVFERIAEAHGPIWYDQIPNPTLGKITSEDLSMCLRARNLGIPVFVHAGVRTTHHKPVWLSEAHFFEQRLLDRVTSAPPPVPPATEATAVVVPVMRRPENAAPFMASFVQSEPSALATVYAVTDYDDHETIQAWKDVGAHVIMYADPDEDRPGTFAEKVNAGYENTDEPWLLLVGDDVRFEPGWLDHAQHASRDGAHVIGTNDLHNPRVTAGEHATHLLIRRAYVDERGASWDGPKVVCHEGYRHWFVDDETVTVAKQRGVWAFAKHSRVEHLHPLWGLAEDDEVYALGRAHVDEDRALFEARLAEHGSAAAVRAEAFG